MEECADISLVEYSIKVIGTAILTSSNLPPYQG